MYYIQTTVVEDVFFSLHISTSSIVLYSEQIAEVKKKRFCTILAKLLAHTTFDILFVMITKQTHDDNEGNLSKRLKNN